MPTTLATMISNMFDRLIRRLRGEPGNPEPKTSQSREQLEPVEALAGAEMPVRWGPYLLLKSVATTRIGECFIGRRVQNTPDIAQSPPSSSPSPPSSPVSAAEELLIIHRGLVRIGDNAPLTLALSEMELFKRLTHPGICALVEVDRYEDVPVIVSEYVRGKWLTRLLQHCRRQQRPLPWTVATFVVHELCTILEYLHAKQDDDVGPWKLVLSRKGGFSPDNILIDYSGQVHLANIGLRDYPAGLDLLPEGTALFEHRRRLYAPETVMGKVPEQSADIFCAGWLLWELLTGQNPFRGQTEFEMLTNIKDMAVPPASTHNREISPEIAIALDAVVAKALSKAPGDRHEHVSDLKRDLADITAMDDAKDELMGLMGQIFAEDRARTDDQIQRWSRD